MKFFLATSLLLVCISLSVVSGYTVTGNKIYDPQGAEVLLRGVDRPSFEWSITGESSSAADYALMRAWGANVVRIALNQDYWLTSGNTYSNTIDTQVTWATATGMGVILDLHWNNGGQQNMADQNSLTFWSQVAGKYKGNNKVIFELYNEPHDVSWSQWLNGDATYAGMQQMYNAVRSAGANNLVLVNGLNWAFDLSGVSAGYSVTGTNIAYATHPYDYPGKQLADWPAAFGNLAKTHPVVMTEFGQYCATNTYVQDLLSYAQSNGIHWTAWAWYPSGCAFPSIISDWNGTPTPGVGVLVKQYLSGNAPSTPVTPVTPVTQAPSNGAGANGAGSSSNIPVVSGSLFAFNGGLSSGWADWSWAVGRSLVDTTYVLSGSKSIKFPLLQFGGIYLHASSSFTLGSYNTVQFYVNGGTASQAANTLSVRLYGPSDAIGQSVNFPNAVAANQWTLISIPVSQFQAALTSPVQGIAISTTLSLTTASIWVDGIAFVPATASSSTPAAQATTKPTTPATAAPTMKSTTPPATAAPTAKPTTTPVATSKPTTAPATPTQAPSASCGIAQVQVKQASSGPGWNSNGVFVTQFNVEITHTCANKKLTQVKFSATNWVTVSSWGFVQTSGPSTVGLATLQLPAYTSVAQGTTFSLGYQNKGSQPAAFTITSATFA